MKLQKNGTAFDLLAIICSFLNKESERAASIKWRTAKESHIGNIVSKYKNLCSIVLKSLESEYQFKEKEIFDINNILEDMVRTETTMHEAAYLLAVEIENSLEPYFDWQSKGVVCKIAPLNSNVEETGIAIFPKLHPCWDMGKSERNRSLILNTRFKNYIMIHRRDASPFEIVMHYWNDRGLLIDQETGWKLKLALSPVMDSCMLREEHRNTSFGPTLGVTGIKNENIVSERVIRTFDVLFPQKFGLIAFPEAIGTREIVNTIKKRMRMHPDYCTFVLLPTLCENGENCLIVLGSGGIECIRQYKATPFILTGDDGFEEREDLNYGNQIHFLLTHELGTIGFAICADLLDPKYYRTLTDEGMVDTILCPSFSPGIQAFKDTFLKAVPLKLLEIYINTCSAKSVSRKGRVSEPLAMVQVPCAEEDGPLKEFKRKCEGQCVNGVCYFDITIFYSYQKKKFTIKGTHCVSA